MKSVDRLSDYLHERSVTGVLIDVATLGALAIGAKSFYDHHKKQQMDHEQLVVEEEEQL